MAERRSAPSARLAFGLTGLVVAMDVAAIGFVSFGPHPSLLLPIAGLCLATAAYGSVGGLIASRASRNPVGWLLCAAALAVSVTALVGGVLGSREEDFASTWLGTLIAWTIVLVPLPVAPASLIAAFLYFPDGRPANRRFRPAVWAAALAGVFLLLGYLAYPGKLGLESAGLQGLGWVQALPRSENFPGVGGLLLLVSGAAAFASLMLRHRRTPVQERGPLRALIRMLGLLVVLVVLGIAGQILTGVLSTGASDFTWPIMALLVLIGTAIVFFGIPAALVVGVLKYRLYEVDLVIRKTIVGTVMASFVVLAFLALVIYPASLFGGIGEIDPSTLVLVLVVILGIGPVRRWARRGADRILYGERATPYEVLSEFSERVGDTYSTEDVLPRMAQLLAVGTGASETRVWLRVGGELREVARSPAELGPRAPVPMRGAELPSFPDDAGTFPVIHQGETLGVITVRMSANDPMDAAKERLARDLAAQAGLVLRNVRLIEELRESRRRIVSAQDERARKLERNIHDGAQQQLVALAVKLRLAEQLTSRDPAKAAEMLAELQVATTETLEDLRDLARGIYPPLLADKGLKTALEAQARKSTVPVSVQARDLGRYPQEIEGAVYFSCLEGLQNIAKYADAWVATVTLEQMDGYLTFSVIDDGRGFDPSAVTHGSGLEGMADRLDAIGGSFRVESAPSRGTTITGRIRIGPAAYSSNGPSSSPTPTANPGSSEVARMPPDPSNAGTG